MQTFLNFPTCSRLNIVNGQTAEIFGYIVSKILQSCTTKIHLNIRLELQDLLDDYAGSAEDNYTNYLIAQILYEYDEDPTGSVQAAAEEMNEMTDYVEEFNSEWFGAEGANITDQS